MRKILPLLFIVAFALSSCFSSKDSNTVLKESFNKTKTKKAILFLKQGDVTVADSYQVSVMNFNDRFETTQIGNTFIVDTDHSNTELNSTSVTLNWISNDTLQIRYDKKLRTFIQQTNIDGITIFYKII